MIGVSIYIQYAILTKIVFELCKANRRYYALGRCMLDQIISKNSLFVIFVVFLAVFVSNCNSTVSQTNRENKRKLSPDFESAEVIGKIRSNRISESSGLAVSKCNQDVFWTHNDSGDNNFIFALNGKGEDLGKWRVTGARNKDWEDIAGYKDEKGQCFLYIGDIGNNSRTRNQLTVYKVREPKVGKQKKDSRTERATAITFSYPDLRNDAESLAVHPGTGAIYIITKRFSGAAGVYKIVAGSKAAKKIADIEVPSMPNGLLTGADIAADGKHLIVCDYFGGYEFTLPEDSKTFDDIWKQKPTMVDLGKRAQGEAVAYGPNGFAVFATSEKPNAPLIRVRRKE
jgi:hypothetical protein